MGVRGKKQHNPEIYNLVWEIYAEVKVLKHDVKFLKKIFFIMFAALIGLILKAFI